MVGYRKAACRLVVFCLLGVMLLWATGCGSDRPYIVQEIDYDLDQAVTAAIMEHNKGLVKDSEFQTESHVLLGAEKKEKVTIVYAMVMYREYGFVGEKFRMRDGNYMPVAMTFAHQPGGQYTLTEYWEPPGGEGYQQAIEKKFPRSLLDKAINLQQYFDIQAWECENKANQYLNSLESKTSES